MYYTKPFVAVATFTLLFQNSYCLVSNDPFSTFNTDQSGCKAIQMTLQRLPTPSQSQIDSFCSSFVGIVTTTAFAEDPVLVTSDLPLKTITVSKAQKRYHGRWANDVAEPTITPPPDGFLRNRQNKGPSIPNIFRGSASSAIRTSCACVGISTQIITTVYLATTSATYTMPSSCAIAPYSAYHLDSLSPASVTAALDRRQFEDPTINIPLCCQWCAESPGCVRFMVNAIPNLPGWFRCTVEVFDMDYDFQDDPANTATGIPALPTDRQKWCPRGYMVAEGLKKDTASTTATEGTFLGRCAVTTVRK